MFVLAFGLSLSALAAGSVNLGSTSSYAILAGSTITNTGSSVISGDLGLHPGTSVTGFPPGVVNGSQQVTTAAALQAQSDLATAFNEASGATGALTVAGDLGGQTLVPGVYKSSSSLGLTGTLTLDAGGDANAVFIFQAGSTLTTASGSNVRLVNGAQACNVFWQVGSSATLGTSSNFSGSILALTSITLNSGANVEGRALARDGAVTLNNNNVSVPSCAVAVTEVAPVVTATTTAEVVATTTPVVVATSTPAVVATSTPIAIVYSPAMPNTGGYPTSFLSLLVLASLIGLVPVVAFVWKAKKA